MSTKPRFGLAVRAGATLSLLFLAGVRATAQDDFEKADAGAPRPAARNEEIPFDVLAFGENPARRASDAPAARSRLETQLGLYLDKIDSVCTLTPAQKKKLDLAGRVEIKRHFDQIDELRRLYEATKKAAAIDRPDPNRFDRITRSLWKMPLAGNHGSFEYASMLYKVCKATLSPEQRTLYRADRRAARESAHRATVQVIVELLDSRAKMTHDQRMKLTELISDETRAVRVMGASSLELTVLVFRTASIPESKIEPIFSADQWRSVAKLLASWKQGEDEVAKVLELLPPDPDLNEPGTSPIAPSPETTKAAAAKAQETAGDRPADKK